MLRVTSAIDIPKSELSEEFIRASGPGGQNVNKVSTAVELRFDVARSPSLPAAFRARLMRLAGRRLTKDGVLVIRAERLRYGSSVPRTAPSRRSKVVDHQLELDWLLDGEIGRLCALEDLVDDHRAVPLQICEGRSADPARIHTGRLGGVAAPRATLPRLDRSYAKKSEKDFPKGAPNILLIMTDDVGFGASSTFGGPIPTPTFDRLAAAGLRYNQFHATALCSPTRAALITGRNHHSNSTGAIMELGVGYPGYHTLMPKSNGTIAELLKQNVRPL